jgi:hypothetical protein
MKMAGCNTEGEFYQKYPSEKAFFAAHPHMKGNQTMKNGGAASGHAGSYWNGDTWVSNEGGSGTYSNGVYYGNGGATFPIGGSAPIFGMGGSASFNISNNDYPSPFAMAPGTGMGSGMLEQYANQIMQMGGPLLPNNPSGYTDSVLNANQNIPFYRDVKAGKVPKTASTFFYDAANSRAMEDDNTNPYSGIRSGVKPMGSYTNEGQYNPLAIGDAYSNESTPPLYFPSQHAASIFQEEINNRIQGVPRKQQGGQVNPYAVSDVRYPEQVNNQAPINETQMGRYRRMVDPNKVNQFHQSLYNTNSASDFFGAVPDIHEPYFGEPATPISKKDNFEYRKGLAERKYGISNYRGTAAQNMELLNRGKRTLNDQWGDWEGHPKDDELISIRQYGGVHPFAMNPGTGSGGGMLQDLPAEMKKGGIHIDPSKRGTFTAAATKHGKGVQEFASQVLANKENYSPAMVKKANFARNASKWQHEYGGMYEDGGSTMPDNPGFRALPPAVQQKIMSNMQTGGMVTDDRMVYGPGGQYMQTGGMINPYHPMAKFLRGGYYQGGGMFGPNGKNPEDETEVPAYTSPVVNPSAPNPNDPNDPRNLDPAYAQQNTASNTGVVQQTPDPTDNAAWTKGMTDQQAQENIKYGKNSVQAYDPLTGDTTDDQYNKVERQNRNAARNQKWQNVSNWGNAILGTGMTALGIGRAYADRRDARNLRNKQFNDRSTANMYAAMNQPGGKGDYTQQGIFRPDSMTPTAAGKFYPGMSGSYNQGMGITAKMGGVMNNYTYAHGGYHAGQELELSDAEINNLKRMGYDIEELG